MAVTICKKHPELKVHPVGTADAAVKFLATSMSVRRLAAVFPRALAALASMHLPSPECFYSDQIGCHTRSSLPWPINDLGLRVPPILVPR